MSRNWLILGVLMNALVLLAAIAGSYALNLYQISQRQAIWCPVLALIIEHPPPSSAPKAARDQFAALSLVSVKFGCPRP